MQQRYTNKGVVNGYTVQEGLSATIRDIAEAGDDITAGVAAGRSYVRVNGVSLDLQDDGALLTKARDDAYADAKTKAAQYAHDAGRSLGAVVTISEAVQQPQYPMAYASGAAVPSSLPFQAGSRSVQVQVSVTFALA